MDKYEKIKHQIFKYNIPCEFIISFFDDVCEYDQDKNLYVFNNHSFKRAKFKNVLEENLSFLNKFYHDSKKKYIQNAYTFKGLHTVIRQLCNYNKIKFEKKIQYMFGNYEIIYNIYMDE